METPTSTAAPQAPAAPAAPPPVPEPAPVAPPPVPPTSPSSSFSGGGILGGISIVGVGMFALTALALFYTIYHHRMAIKAMKTSRPQDRKDIDEIKGNLKAMMGPEYKEY